MITSIHSLIYSDDTAATRAFLGDVLGWPSVEDPDSEPGWLIFRTGPSELGVHPTGGAWEGEAFHQPRHHELALMCDDIAATKAELEAKGATCTGDVEDYGFGLGVMMDVPGADAMLLYQPKHPTAYDL